MPGLDVELQASDQGRFRVRWRRWRGQWRKSGWRILTLYLKGDRYPRIRLYLNNKGVLVRAHIPMLYAWSGPPQPGQVARHKDDNPHNLKPSNLVWGTRRQNMEDAIANGRVRWLGMKRAQQVRREAEEIGDRRSVVATLAQRHGFTRTTIRCVLNGISYAEGVA